MVGGDCYASDWQDQITAFCRRLLYLEDPAELRPVAKQLQSAISERMDPNPGERRWRRDR